MDNNLLKLEQIIMFYCASALIRSEQTYKKSIDPAHGIETSMLSCNIRN